MSSRIRVGGSEIVWFGDEFERELGLTIKKKLKLAAEVTANQVKRNISKGRPASKPGDFPHVDTGRLRNSIFWDLQNDTTAIVGTTVEYGLFLEIGTSTMAPRPYLRRTLNEMKNKINRIFAL